MCGIAGIVSLKKPIQIDLVKKMNDIQKHRGPDDEGILGYDIRNKVTSHFFTDDSNLNKGKSINSSSGVFDLLLGHRRLSIIDVTSAGHQPMSYDSNQLFIVFNGEIYNYKELKNKLLKKGYSFKTNTDTEVILASYHLWGKDCCKYFNGDWAFAIMDIKKNVLFISRDRSSIKPLYYYYDLSLKTLAFSSEIKALMELPFVSKEINNMKCFEFLNYSISDHSSETMYDDIHQLESGNSMEFDLSNLQMKKHQYYKLRYTSLFGSYSHKKAREYAENIRYLLKDSIRIRLRADVPIGTCLSGGLDSSSISVLINQLLIEKGMTQKEIFQNQKTFTASFLEDPIDESKFANIINNKINGDSHFTYPTKNSFLDTIENLVLIQEEPFSGGSIYAQYEVMKLAKNSVTVVLDGQGGDELFGGYNHFKTAYYSEILKNLKFDKFINQIIKSFQINNSIRSLLNEVKGIPFFILPLYLKSVLFRVVGKRMNKISHNFPKSYYDDLTYLNSFKSNLNECLYYSYTKYNLPRLLHWEDRNSMIFSLESRTPFTDYRLVDYVFSIPSIYKIYNGWSKYLLRIAMEDVLPKQIVWRKTKVGFEVPNNFKNIDRFSLYKTWYES